MSSQYGTVAYSSALSDDDMPRVHTRKNSSSSSKLIKIVLALVVLVGAAVLIVWLVTGGKGKKGRQDPSERLRELESSLLAVPSVDSLADFQWMLSNRSTLAGAESLVAAELMVEKLRSFGWTAELDQYDVYLSRPLDRSVEVWVDGALNASAAMLEPPVAGDPHSQPDRAAEVAATFLAYAPNATVSGRVVYVNFGRVEDFALVEQHVNLTGTVALMRMGHIFRGLKIYHAQERGCVGVVLYSDPAQTGTPPYPEGPYRPDFAVERGSTMFLSLYPGDPETPLVPSLPGNATRREYTGHEAPVLAKIPAMALGAKDVLAIFQAMRGPPVASVPGLGDAWTGGLDATYRLNGGDGVQVRVQSGMDNSRRLVHNVIATLAADAASPEADQIVFGGSHFDAWTWGAVDPHSSAAVLLEAARALGELHKAHGWKPRRTIRLGFWDAEEYGLIGSVEHVEQHAAALAEHCVAYLNIDAAVTGANFSLAASPSLRQAWRDVAADVAHPDFNVSVLDSWTGRDAFEWLGSGSDWTAFLHHLGVASTHAGLSCTNNCNGVYHSLYDSLHWMERFGDPGYRRHQLMTRLYALAVFRFASAPVLPFELKDYATALESQVGELERFLNESGAAVNLSRIETGLATLGAAIDRFTEVVEREKKRHEKHAKHADDGWSGSSSSSSSDSAALAAEQTVKVNKGLYLFERELIHEPGLPYRTAHAFYRHMVVAPGLDTGYAAKLFPGVRETVAAGDVALAQEYAGIIAGRFERAAEHLQFYAGEIKQPPRVPIKLIRLG